MSTSPLQCNIYMNISRCNMNIGMPVHATIKQAFAVVFLTHHKPTPVMQIAGEIQLSRTLGSKPS